MAAIWTALRRRYKAGAVATAVLAGAVVGGLSPAVPLLDGPVFDLGVAARWYLGGGVTRVSNDIAVVGVDWASLDQPDMARYPRSLFGPFWGRLVDTLAEAGASVVVFDMVFNYSGNMLLPNHDRPFIQSLAANRGRVVLGRTGDTVPARPFMVAAGPAGVALTEVVADGDGVVRTVRPWFADLDGRRHLTLSGAALQAAGWAVPDGPVRFLPRGPLEIQFPTYSMGTVLRLGESEDGRRLLHERLSSKVVFVGTIVVEEDRKGAPDRFLLKSGAPPDADGSALPRLGISGPRSATLPGVYLHAAAVEAGVTGAVLRDVPAWGGALLGGVAAGCVAWAAVALWLPLAVAVGATASLLLVALSWWAAPMGWMVPVGGALVVVFLAVPLGFGLRYLAVERRRGNLQRAFGHYVAPAVVARLAQDDNPPALGGEDREITCLFADLSGFTAMSTAVSAAELMEVTNRYLELITRAVDDAGGYVDKYIGDAVMALFNAPAEYADHPLRAVRAAMAAAEAVAAEAARGGRGFSVKIGVNTGHAVVGNMGAPNRLNYTAVGKAVNVASRLEPLPPLYGCSVILSAAAASRLAGQVAVCEVDLVRVKGVAEPVAIFTPLPSGNGDGTEFMTRWRHALWSYRDGCFSQAVEAFAMVPVPAGWHDDVFGPARILSERASRLAQSPPATWDGSWSVGKG